VKQCEPKIKILMGIVERASVPPLCVGTAARIMVSMPFLYHWLIWLTLTHHQASARISF